MVRGINKFFQDAISLGRVSLMVGGFYLNEEHKASKYSGAELEDNLPPLTTYRKVKDGYSVTMHIEGWNSPVKFRMKDKKKLQIRSIALYRTIKEFKR